jgi:hypothetical protein
MERLLVTVQTRAPFLQAFPVAVHGSSLTVAVEPIPEQPPAAVKPAVIGKITVPPEHRIAKAFRPLDDGGTVGLQDIVCEARVRLNDTLLLFTSGPDCITKVELQLPPHAVTTPA